MDEGRSEKNSGTEPVTVSREEETLLALKRELPDYVVESFMATGYDTLQVIAKMDTSRNPGNSLEEIEQFISTEFIEDPHFARGVTSIYTFKFLPGDRQRIINFVSNIRKNLDQEEKAKRLNIKRTATKSNHAQFIKRKKENSDTDVVSNDTGDLLDQAKAVTMVQQQICKWQRSQSSSKIKELKMSISRLILPPWTTVLVAFVLQYPARCVDIKAHSDLKITLCYYRITPGMSTNV